MRSQALRWILLCLVVGLLNMPLAHAQQTGCCLQMSYGGAHPPDHGWRPDPANPDAPNLMMHAKLCLPTYCKEPIVLTGLQLKAVGTGNDSTDIARIRVHLDQDCDGNPDGIWFDHPGGFPADDGVLTLCGPNTPLTLAPGQCVCLLIEYVLYPNAQCERTYQFALTGALAGPNCQPVERCPGSEALRSAIKTVRCDDCCLEVGYGPLQPPDHDYACVPGTVPPPNFMQHVRICNPCPEPQYIRGIEIKAGGTGNDPLAVQSVQVFLDKDCDGKPDGNPVQTGAYTADNGTLQLCSATSPLLEVMPGECICLIVVYRMNCPTPVGTYYFDLTNILGRDCKPLCAEVLPLRSAVKNVPSACCLEVANGPHFPPDHTYTCVPGANPEPNFMGEFRVCNPCNDTRCVYGLKLKAFGSGDDAAGIAKVLVSLDFDCDGKPESVNVLTGKYAKDNDELLLCSPTGAPLFCLRPGQCVCVQVHYIMECPVPSGTYGFALEALLGGTECAPICAEPLPLVSAVKTVTQEPCCLEVSPGPKMPADHVYQCPPTGGQGEHNFMQQVRICNPCRVPMPISGVRLKAWGSGNDATGIAAIELMIDVDCDGIPDVGPVVGKYAADNGDVVLCSTAAPLYTLKPGECVCLNIYYRMKCPNPVPGTYLFELREILGSDCKPVCAEPLPVKSAVKTIEPRPCCLRVTEGPNNPPSHAWAPGFPKRNTMFQVQVCNPCDNEAKLGCLSLWAFGTGNDKNDISQIRVYWDLNCDGKLQAGEPLYGTGSYPADNGIANICPTTSVILPPGQCACLLVVYVMNPPATPGGTYGMRLVGLDAEDPATGQKLCVDGLPLASNVKKRCYKIGEIKHVAVGTRICLTRKVITAVFPDRYYVQEPFSDSTGQDPDGGGVGPGYSAGVAVLRDQTPIPGDGPGFVPEVGMLVDLEGTTDVIGCEVVVNPGGETAIGLLLPAVQKARMNNLASGGGRFGNQSGVVDAADYVVWRRSLNNIGMLVQLHGRVTARDGLGNFWIDDGSNLKDGTGDPFGNPHVGVKVNGTMLGRTPPVGSYVTVGGIMRAEPHRGLCIRCLYPRGIADVEIVSLDKATPL